MLYKNSLLENDKFSVEIDLVKDLQDISKQRLKSMGYQIIDTANEDWIRLYFNAQKRLISNTPRTVVKSKEFQCPDKFLPALQEIENCFTEGRSLVPYMTTHIKYSKKKDLLLYDWGIYHFHIGLKKPNEQFSERSDQELFVFIKETVAYFIQTYPHTKKHLYATQEKIKILHDNWPEIIEDRRIVGVTGATGFTDKEYDEIRKSGGSVLLDVGNGDVYGLLGGGYASNGSSLEVTRNADYWKRIMRAYQKTIIAEANNIIKGIYKLTNIEAIRDLKIKMIHLTDDEISLFEGSNNVCLQMYRNETFYRICYPQDLFREQENYKWIKMR